MRAALVCLMLVCITAPANAQRVGRENYRVQDVSWSWQASQPAGAALTASAGSAMIERRRIGTFTTVNIKERSRSVGGFLGATLWDNQDMVAETIDGVFQACGFDRDYRYCAFDKDGDGAFETGLVQYSISSPELTAVTMKKPIPYGSTRQKAVPAPEGDFRQELVYNGAAGGVLRLGYREFVNDMARPAFSNEVTFQLSGKFPEEIAYKDIVIEVHGVSNAGIRYSIKPAASVK